MNSARKPLRVTSDPGGYDKYGGRGYSRRSSSPGPGERDTGGGDRERDRGPYSKYNNHSRHGGDYKYGRAKDIRDADRERDRSPRDRKNWDYKDKIRDKDGGDNNRGGGGGGGGGGHNNLASFGDWSEQMSSRGKKYYYNSVTDKTQWEKPSEWVDAERTRQSYSNRVQDKSRDWGDHDKMRNSVKLHCDRNNRSSQDKHGLDHRSSPVSSASLSSSRHRERLGGSRGNHHTNNSSAGHNNHHNNSNHTNSSRGSEHSNNSYSLRDWDRGSEGRGGAADRGDSHRESRDRGVSECSTGDATPTSEGEGDLDTGRGDLGSTHPGGAVSLSAAISRISQPQAGLSVSTSQHGPGPGSRGAGSTLTSPGLTAVSPVSASELTAGPGCQSLSSPSLMSRLPSALAPAPIQLTPSLSRLYKEQLIGHVLAWPAEPVERVINKVSEDANQISNHAITKVSADLKMARSLVRLAEIQATLQEQRILFLRQQMTDLERMETSWVTRGSAPSLSSVSSTPTREAPTSSSLYPPHHRDSNDSRDSALSAGSPASESGSLSHQDHSQHLHHGDPSLSHPASLAQSSLLGLHVGNSVNYSNNTA